jgi:hypothetical protein
MGLPHLTPAGGGLMNPESAYELHTDLGRALLRPDSGAYSWMSNRITERTSFNRIRDRGASFIDPVLRAARMAAKEPVEVAITTTYRITEPDHTDEAADAVGVIDPTVLFDKHNPPPPAPEGAPEARLYALNVFTEVTCIQLADAPTFYITRDMCQLLAHAAGSMDETDVMPYHPGYPSGFAVLATPLELPYGDGTTQVIDAFGWTEYGEVATAAGTVGHAGVVWQFVNRTKHPKDRTLPKAQGHYPSASAWRNSPELVPQLGDTYLTGTLIGAPAVPSTVQPGSAELVGRFQPYLAAFLLLLAQKITAPEAQEVDPASVRRAQKVSPRRPSTVTVVDLRRRPGSAVRNGARPTGRKFDYRFPVAGFWRWQPYGPQGRLRKRIFVEDFIRGPEDGPLIIKPRVRRL